MVVGDKVEVVDASRRYEWKRDLIGKKGTVDQVTDKALAVRFVGEGEYGDAHPVWFAKDCVKEV